MKTKKACPPKPWCRRGSALLLTTILMFIILSMIVSLTYVTVMEQKMSQKTKSSVGAFYGAESGVEWALNKIATGTGTTISTKFGTQATNAATDGKMSCPFTGCEVYLLGADGKVIPKTKFSVADSADLVKAVRSVGAQGADTQRAIEAAVAGTDLPTGAVVAFDLPLCPNGWKPADGTQGTHDLRGYFIRGLNTTGSGPDPGRSLGTPQGDELRSHNHIAYFGSTEQTLAGGGNNSNPGSSGVGTSYYGGAETRPKNVALLYCVKQ